MLKLILALAALTGLAPSQPQTRYAEGQVWEYRTRPSDEGSLLKIQRIEEPPVPAAQGPIYHISIIGLHMAGQVFATEIQHAPVSRETLDASVTRLSDSRAEFPSIEEGIAEWRRAGGGVYTIPVAEIAAAVEQAMRGISTTR